VVKAKDKEDAIFLLDELAGAGLEDLTALNDFMVHFRLSTDEKLEPEGLESLVELEGFGERTADKILEKAYPIFDKALKASSTEADDTPPEEGRETIRQAVSEEKTRLWPSKTERPGAKTDPSIN
jgi:hypothetical protein